MQNKKRALYILFKASLNRQTRAKTIVLLVRSKHLFLCAGFATKTTNAYFSKKFNLLEQTSYENCFVRCLSCTITKALCTKAQY